MPLRMLDVGVPSHTARKLDKDLKAAGIEKVTPEGKLDFHAFRSVYISLVIESGATVKQARALARHSTPELTMNVYARVRDTRLSDVVEMVGKSIQSEKTFDLCVTPPDVPQKRVRHKSSQIKNLIDVKELVEAAGIEPASESASAGASTCLAFPLRSRRPGTPQARFPGSPGEGYAS